MERGAIPGLQPDTVQRLEVVGSVAVVVGSATDQTAPAFRLGEAAVGGDAWKLVGPASEYGAGPEPSPNLVGSGSSAWFFQVDRVSVDGSRRSGGTWQAWQPPCVGENGPMALAAASSVELRGCVPGRRVGTIRERLPHGGPSVRLARRRRDLEGRALLRPEWQLPTMTRE